MISPILEDHCFLFPDVSGMMGSVEDWTRLGDYVVARRVELGYRTRHTFAQDLGVSTRVIGDIEKGRRGNFDKVTIASLERLLGWTTGSAMRVVRGGEPELVPATGEQTTAGGPLDPDVRRWVAILADPEVPFAQKALMREQMRIWSDQIEAYRRPANPDRAASAR